LAEIELRCDSTGTGRARRTSSEKPRPSYFITSGPSFSWLQRPFLPMNLERDLLDRYHSPPASLFLFAVTVLEPPLRSRNIARFGVYRQSMV
jgi:hypothetical protein